MKKIGTIVRYYPADNDGQIVDRNGAKFFPALITQTNEGDTRVNLCVFSWNGIAPVIGVDPVPENFDPDQPRDFGFYQVPDDAVNFGFGDAISSEQAAEIAESIKKTQAMIESHAQSFDDVTKKIIDDCNHRIEVLTDLVNNYSSDMSNRIAELEKRLNGEPDKKKK